MIKGLIFDFDNTLMDFMKMKRAASASLNSASSDPEFAGETPIEMASAAKSSLQTSSGAGSNFASITNPYLNEGYLVSMQKVPMS